MRKELFLTILLGMGLIFGCGGGGGSSSGVDTSRRVSASNIVFSDSSSSANNNTAKAYNAAYTGVDDSTRILAENVVVDTTANALTSNNLQDALNNEIAIDLAQLLPGTTWTITNKTLDARLTSATSQITFNSDGTVTLSGILAVCEYASYYVGNPALVVRNLRYELVGNNVIYWSGEANAFYNTNPSFFQASERVTAISIKNKDYLTLIGSSRLSVLTRNSSVQKTGFKTEKKLKSTGALLVSNKK